MCHPNKLAAAHRTTSQALDDPAVPPPIATALFFLVDSRLGLWRVMLNGLFFGTYRSAACAQKAIDDAHEAFGSVAQVSRN